MSNKILIIAPHPDDETLACGGSILKHIKNKDEVHWLIITNYRKKDKNYKIRQKEIKRVAKAFSFSSTYNLDLEPATLDNLPIIDLINLVKEVINKIKPNLIYAPFINDVHTDHQVIAKVVSSFAKWFRYPYIEQINMYETISETNFNFAKDKFCPNLYSDITDFFEKKIKILKIYDSEIKEHPFPRSVKSVESIAALRGSESGYRYAEAFQILIKRK